MRKKNNIVIKGASEHNLKSIHVDIPHNSITVITGVSGSGKSSLAYDIIFREGQKRYLETFSSLSRQHLGKMNRAKVDHISGLRPTIAVDQKSVVKNPRSTVGTLSEIYDYLRLLFAQTGEKRCPKCNALLTKRTEEDLLQTIYNTYLNKSISLMASMIDGHKGEYIKALSNVKKAGFKKVLIDDVLYDIKEITKLEKDKVHQIDIFIAQVLVNEANKTILTKKLHETLATGNNIIKIKSENEIKRYALKEACPNCKTSLPEYGPRLFSFNSTYGACPNCKGLGVEDHIDEELLIRNENRSLREQALVITTPNGYTIYSQVTIDVLNKVCQQHGFNVDIPWKDLTREQKDIILFGSNKIKIPFGKHTLESRMKWSGITAKPREEGYYKGIIPVMEEILRRDRNPNILRFTKSVPCHKCGGKKLSPAALSVFVRDKNIDEISSMSIDRLIDYIKDIETQKGSGALFEDLTDIILKRCLLLQKLGLGYLTLSRSSVRLSGGEAQRIRLATQACSELRGLIYVLDEPSIGLHQKDSQNLIDLLKQLRDNGNTVIVVEHDDDIIRQADYLIDLGPGAGINGGKLVYSGNLKDFLSSDKTIPDSLTRQHLLKPAQNFGIPKHKGPEIKLFDVSKHNLKSVNPVFFAGLLNVVTGVSGAGKKTLVKDVIAKNIRNYLKDSLSTAENCSHTSGFQNFNKLIEIDQSPIGKTPRSNPATYTGLFDYIRDLFANLPASKKNGWKKGVFSFNVKGGRCEECQGAGVKQIGMHFLGNVDILCESCSGKRFLPEVLEVKYNDKSISEILELSINEALDFFSNHKKIHHILLVLVELGLGYIKLGQPSTTLSGGEAQRIKLATELSKQASGKTLYILEEPTTGLHFYDVEILLKSLKEITKKGNTILAIEHHPYFISSSDWVVDLGPESGEKGGEIVAMGSPADIAKTSESFTGKMLSNHALKTSVTESSFIVEKPVQLRGVSTHNLKKINVDFPENKITLVTGVSGSGKSSLVFDTLFAECQNRYLENLPTYSRRYIKTLQKGSFEMATNIMPAIAIKQRKMQHNPRSTVGTLTEIYDYYRLLYSRAGKTKGKITSYTAAHFSFNSHAGACPVCNGLGAQMVADPEKLITHPEKSILEGAMNGTNTGKFYGEVNGQYVATLKTISQKKGIDFSKPYYLLDEIEKNIIMYGIPNETQEVVWDFKRKNRKGSHKFNTIWKGITYLVNEEYERKHADNRGESMMNVMKEVICDECQGTRLNKDVNRVVFNGKNIHELCNLSIEESLVFFREIPRDADYEIIKTISTEIISRLNYLNKLGLGYLNMNRVSHSLSGGEAQRVRLASILGSELTGLIIILDEPTIGLHPVNTQNLIEQIKRLQKLGNTIIIVEHDKSMMQIADNIIDMGPGAGSFGGEIVARGNLEEIIRNPQSITGRYLSDRNKSSFKNEKINHHGSLKIQKASANNLKQIDVTIPLGGLTVITGVSGSGKSSLLFEVIAKSYQSHKAVNCSSITGFEKVNEVLIADQSSVNTSPLSIPATFLGVFDEIRAYFTKMAISKKLDAKKSYFSYLHKDGKCETCNGMGKQHLKMDFMADMWVRCETCKGARYNNSALSFVYKEKTIADVLNMTFSEAKSYFSENKKLDWVFEIMEKIGLDYLLLGQSLNTLSGGEAQRLKLIKSMISDTEKPNLYLLDEPTTGLHFADIEKLLQLFMQMLNKNHTLIVIEHNPEIIKAANYILDLGPDGGNKGGYIVYQGKVDELKNCRQSLTGKFLK